MSRYSDTVSVYICATLSFILTVQYSDYRLCHCGGIGGGNKKEFFQESLLLSFSIFSFGYGFYLSFFYFAKDMHIALIVLMFQVQCQIFVCTVKSYFRHT